MNYNAGPRDLPARKAPTLYWILHESGGFSFDLKASIGVQLAQIEATINPEPSWIES